MMGVAGGAAVERLKEGESLLWEGRPLLLPFLLGSPRVTGLGAGAVLFFLAGALLTLLDRAVRLTATAFILIVAAAFCAGYLLGAYLDWRALRLALTDRRFLAFGEGFPLGGWELSIPLEDIVGVEIWGGWADGTAGCATLVVHGVIRNVVHVGIWPGVPEAPSVEGRLRDHVLPHARRAGVPSSAEIDGESATKVALRHAFAPGERLLWAGRGGKVVYALTDRRLLALEERGRFLTWLRLDGLGKARHPSAHVGGLVPRPERFRPGAGVPLQALKGRGMEPLLSILSEALSSLIPGWGEWFLISLTYGIFWLDTGGGGGPRWERLTGA